jgi:hypothetical protein
MDRVVLGGCFLLVALGVLLGLGVSAEESLGKSIRNAMELLSFAGTAVTGVVAIIALTSWQSQFRFTEKFNSLKELKNTSIDLFYFVAYLETVVSNNWSTIENGLPDDQSKAKEEEARQKWHKALDSYIRAWGSVAVFLTQEEKENFLGSPTVFINRSLEDAMKINLSRVNSTSGEKLKNLLSVAHEVTTSARELYESTVAEVEAMLSRHAVK